MTEPFFSVVVPTYNRSVRMKETVSKILDQLFTDFEIIVVDDGSTDDTATVLGKTFSIEKRFRLISQPNMERGAARNTGLKNSRGRYVVFFDSDDVMHENHLEVLYRNIAQENFPDFIATKFDFVDEKGNHFPSDMKQLRQGFYDYKLFLNGNPLACNVCVRRDNPDLVKFEEDRRYAIKEDWLFMFDNLKKHRLFIVDKVTISMADHPDRSMRSDNSEIIRRTLLARDRILQRAGLTKVEQQQLEAHVNYFCGIHSYLDSHRKESVDFAVNAIRTGGLKTKYVMLLAKSLIGRSVIRLVK